MPFHPDQLLLYAVTDRAWTGRQTLLEQLEAALQGGVTLVQLREKDLDPAAFLAEALEVKALCRRYHVPLILNDQVDLALACGADGVHVGSEALPVAHIRRRAGPDFIIGATAKTVQQAQAAQAAGGRVQVHLKADTGMGRIGFALRTDFDAAIAAMVNVCRLPGLQVTGLFQHFAVADETSADPTAYTQEQYGLFLRTYQALKAAGFEPPLLHCDNSAGVMLHPDWPDGLPAERCMARPGIILYGYDPSDEVRSNCFAPVMKLKTVVSQVKTLQPGQCVSYGRRFTAQSPTRAATLCAGYADGYSRFLSCGQGIVEISGTPCPVLGRVCMDQMLVDVSALPQVQEGDEAILWGGSCSDSAETIARKIGTIPYELLCGVSRRVPRVYLSGGQIIAVEDWILNN